MAPASPLIYALGSGAIAHLIFKRTEPRSLLAIFSLLFALPLTASLYTSSPSLPSPFLVFKCTLTHVATLISLTVAYRLSPFHPLAAYPGPPLAKVTRFWTFNRALKQDQYRVFHALFAQYGPIVRIGPNHLIIRDKSAVPLVLGSRHFFKGARYTATLPPNSTGSIISLTDPTQHSHRRRIWERAFTSSSLRDYEPVLAHRTDLLIAALTQQADDEKAEKKTIDLARWLGFLSFDIMGDLAFGGIFHLTQSGVDENGFTTLVGKGVHFQEILGSIPWIRPIYLQIAKVLGAQKAYYEMGRRALEARKARGAQLRDVFFHILGEDEDGKKGKEELAYPSLISEATLAVVAGSDTTGTALSNAFFYLLTHPAVFASLRAELDGATPPGTDAPPPSVLADLPLLNAVINETLRLQPAIPAGVQRVRPDDADGIVIGDAGELGAYVPPGTTVQIPTWSLHRDPRYFSPDPEEFIPDRWIADGALAKREDYKLDRDAFMPFSYGPTNCVGRNLARLEMRIAIAALVLKLDFALTHDDGWTPDEWERDLKDGFILKKGRLPCVVRPRVR
ncbi:cytochrome P450 [Punctularia strigosozonata HHB-11173 SS5]|uniref:cytochrome P450 n=1 Tax=Punctularia strigosozonata (strain HHB-11173) TaxID=741275 RepID=UPI0004417B10|nr:cytochrome P450 [Punctularia strigosozonata HHB-11173 SS5]EIN08535.1 cytochrome P450 [Punctularia strigosozonata HHB-11173 SS5]